MRRSMLLPVSFSVRFQPLPIKHENGGIVIFFMPPLRFCLQILSLVFYMFSDKYVEISCDLLIHRLAGRRGRNIPLGTFIRAVLLDRAADDYVELYRKLLQRVFSSLSLVLRASLNLVGSFLMLSSIVIVFLSFRFYFTDRGRSGFNQIYHRVPRLR